MISDWRRVQRQNFSSIPLLADFLQLSEEDRSRLLGKTPFPLNLPRRLAEKMEKGNLADPLLLQFVPLVDEEEVRPGFVADPVRDLDFLQEKKLLQKYEGRILLLTTSACAMHCRFCFRKNFPYETGERGFEVDLKRIEGDRSISEVILSGGDPLSLSEGDLLSLFSALEGMDHIKRIRFHTRFPIGIPERIDEGFLSLLRDCSKQVYFILHVNHPRELDEDLFSALKQVHRTGASLLSQTVLLKGVNDSGEVLLELFEALIDHGIVPYYLHCLDPVLGTGHFDVSEEKGKELIQYLKERLSGFGVPRLVREIPNERSKHEIY